MADREPPAYDANGRVSDKRGPGQGDFVTLTKPSVAQVIHWKSWKQVTRIPGDVREYIERVWAPKIPKLYEELFEHARNGDHVSEQALDILKTMTLMTRSLTPAGLREASNADSLGLPSDVDLTHISTGDLAKLARKELSAPLDHKEHERKAQHAKMMRAKKADGTGPVTAKAKERKARRKAVSVLPAADDDGQDGGLP